MTPPSISNTTEEQKTARAMAALDTMAAMWAASFDIRKAAEAMKTLPDGTDRLIAFIKQAHCEGLYAGRTSLAAQPQALPQERKPLTDDAFLALRLGMELMTWNRARPESQRFVKVAYETAVAAEVLRAYREIESAHVITAQQGGIP